MFISMFYLHSFFLPVLNKFIPLCNSPGVVFHYSHFHFEQICFAQLSFPYIRVTHVDIITQSP